MPRPFANVLVDNRSEARRVTRDFLVAGFSPPRLFLQLSNAEAAEPARPAAWKASFHYGHAASPRGRGRESSGCELGVL